jgi:murein DD-endopeptidase MepM/ murein hydrolase activator NlpD
MRRQPDVMAIVALGFFLFLIQNALRDKGVNVFGGANPDQVAQSSRVSGPNNAAIAKGLASPPDSTDNQPVNNNLDQNIIASPYDHFILTQGLHGQMYSQLAIDIAAGKGTVIKSPINGQVAALYVDDLGNTTLILENDRYVVTLLHGLFTVSVGEAVTIGQPVGTESNQGNTVDAYGRSCRGRDCGYHLHINVYDKQLGANLNPLDLFT